MWSDKLHENLENLKPNYDRLHLLTSFVGQIINVKIYFGNTSSSIINKRKICIRRMLKKFGCLKVLNLLLFMQLMLNKYGLKN
jgi:hypothetical protein